MRCVGLGVCGRAVFGSGLTGSGFWKMEYSLEFLGAWYRVQGHGLPVHDRWVLDDAPSQEQLSNTYNLDAK